MTLYCPICCTPFERIGRKNTCSDDCLKELRREARKEVDKRYAAKPEAKAKRREASRRYYRTSKRGQERAERKRLRDHARAAKPILAPKPPPECVICGTVFRRRATQKTCSKPCSRKLKGQNGRAYQPKYMKAYRACPEGRALSNKASREYRARQKAKRQAEAGNRPTHPGALNHVGMPDSHT